MEEPLLATKQTYMGIDLDMSTWTLISTTVALAVLYITKRVVAERNVQVSKIGLNIYKNGFCTQFFAKGCPTLEKRPYNKGGIILERKRKFSLIFVATQYKHTTQKATYPFLSDIVFAPI